MSSNQYNQFLGLTDALRSGFRNRCRRVSKESQKSFRSSKEESLSLKLLRNVWTDKAFRCLSLFSHKFTMNRFCFPKHRFEMIRSLPLMAVNQQIEERSKNIFPPSFWKFTQVEILNLRTVDSSTIQIERNAKVFFWEFDLLGTFLAVLEGLPTTHQTKTAETVADWKWSSNLFTL